MLLQQGDPAFFSAQMRCPRHAPGAFPPSRVCPTRRIAAAAWMRHFPLPSTTRAPSGSPTSPDLPTAVIRSPVTTKDVVFEDYRATSDSGIFIGCVSWLFPPIATFSFPHV